MYEKFPFEVWENMAPKLLSNMYEWNTQKSLSHSGSESDTFQ